MFKKFTLASSEFHRQETDWLMSNSLIDLYPWNLFCRFIYTGATGIDKVDIKLNSTLTYGGVGALDKDADFRLFLSRRSENFSPILSTCRRVISVRRFVGSMHYCNQFVHIMILVLIQLSPIYGATEPVPLFYFIFIFLLTLPYK